MNLSSSSSLSPVRLRKPNHNDGTIEGRRPGRRRSLDYYYKSLRLSRESDFWEGWIMMDAPIDLFPKLENDISLKRPCPVTSTCLAFDFLWAVLGESRKKKNRQEEPTVNNNNFFCVCVFSFDLTSSSPVERLISSSWWLIIHEGTRLGPE
jgi:hypothetical protein